MDAFDVLDIDAAADVKPAKRKLAEAAPTVAEPPPAKFKPPAELKPETGRAVVKFGVGSYTRGALTRFYVVSTSASAVLEELRL